MAASRRKRGCRSRRAHCDARARVPRRIRPARDARGRRSAARRRGSASRARRSPPRDHHADDQRSRPARRAQGPPERRHRLGTRSPCLSDLANGAHRTWPPASAAAHLLSTPERLALGVGAYAVAMSVAAASVIRASTSGSRARWLAWSSVALYVAFAGVSLALEFRFVGRVSPIDIWSVAALFACGVVGALIVTTHRTHPIGWMFCGAAVSFGFSFFAREYAIQALVVAPVPIPFGQAMAWFGFWADMPGIAVLALFLPLLFPDGRLPSPRWKPAAYFAGVNFVLAVALTMVAPATYAHAGYPSIRNPIGLDQYAAFFDAIGVVLEPLLLVLVVVSALALFDRVRRAGEEEREQIKWFAFAGALVLFSFLMQAAARFVPSLAGPSDFVASLAVAALPAAVGIAILRYHLYDIDLIINRTVVYVLLTAALGGLYTASLALFQRLFVATTGQGSDLAIVLTLFVLATVFTPIKNTLQERVDHRIKPAKAASGPAGPRAGIDDLLMLAELHRNGVLTDDEFAAKKRQVLGL